MTPNQLVFLTSPLAAPAASGLGNLGRAVINAWWMGCAFVLLALLVIVASRWVAKKRNGPQ
ncbi:MAG: hypothetical protein LBR19_00190 [Bifidobacteriaceae bacterium]|jgi:hypothetical protein|nr:hypothetical protein [Bifidobacteriaceae bacterium]